MMWQIKYIDPVRRHPLLSLTRTYGSGKTGDGCFFELAIFPSPALRKRAARQQTHALSREHRSVDTHHELVFAFVSSKALRCDAIIT
eukprot:2054019-Pyramimonas_sp.AAC.2